MLKDRAAIQHIYSVGPTGSGKSYKLKQRAREIRMAGYPVYVCTGKADPSFKALNGGRLSKDVEEWRTDCGATHITHDPHYFPDLYFAGQLGPCLIVFDEGAADIGMNPDPKLKRLFQICRDSGVMLAVNSQKYTGVNPQIRENCKELYLFNCSRKDMQSVVDDYRFDSQSEEVIKRATNLGLYEHLHVDNRNRIAEIVDRNGRAI